VEKFNCPVETMGNEWGKIQLKIRITKQLEIEPQKSQEYRSQQDFM
jgi:hypothetical protein